MERISLGGRPVVGLGGVQPVVGLGGASLPSGDAALRFVKGERGAIIDVASTTMVRSALIAAGLLVAGFRGTKLLKGTLGAGLAVEAGVLAWAWKNKRET
jgi:hypothetical protein